MIDLPGASENLRELAARGVRRSYATRTVLIQEGDVGNTLFIIVSGRLRAYSADDVREITYGSYGPGEYVGEMSLDGQPRSASVATEERCVCMVVTRRTLEAFIVERPAFAFELLEKVIARARAATLSARQMALNDVYGRLRYQLETMAVAGPDGTRCIKPRPTHAELGHLIGCSRAMVSRQVKDLERGGHLRMERDAIVMIKALPVRW